MDIFEDVKQALNIRQVIEFYGVRVNRDKSFCCPFHNEKHPSASIKNDYFNCFACGAGGDLITYTAKYFSLSNYEACKKLIEDFRLNIDTAPEVTPQEIRKTAECNNVSRLRAYNDSKRNSNRQLAISIVQAQEKRNKEAALDKLIHDTGRILASYHCYLWQGLQLYPYGHIRHTRALQELTQAVYYLDCYDNAPEEYSIEARKQVEEIGNRLHRWNNEG